MSHVLDEHRHYLADRTRVETFAAALAAIVRPGDIVIDLGTGTGILGVLACRAGASRVYAIDSTPTIELARSLAAANGMADRFVFIRDRSTRVTLPEPADVVVADQLGAFGYGAGVLEYFADARARLLKPGGRTVPANLRLIVAPVESDAARERVDFWNRNVSGVDLAPIRVVASSSAHAIRFAAGDLLAAPGPGVWVPCDTLPSAVVIRETHEAMRAGSLHGIGAWFEAELAPGIVLTNSPAASTPIDREQLFYPVDRTIAVRRGDRLSIEMTIRPTDRLVKWAISIADASGATTHRSVQSSLGGLLIGASDVERASPDYVPQLGPWEAARRDALQLCDGQRTTAAIEHELRRRYPDLFRGDNDVSRFVGEVVNAN